MNMTLKARLSTMIGLLLLLSIGIGVLGLYGMSQSNEGLRTVYEDRTIALEQISHIDGLLVRNRLALAEALLDPTATNIKTKSELIEKNAAEISKTLDQYTSTDLTSEEKQLVDKFTMDRTKMVKEGLFPAVAALREGNLDVTKQLQEQFQSLTLPVREGVKALIKLQVDVAKDEYDQASAHYATLRSSVIAVIALGALIAVLLGFFLIRNIYRQLGGEPEYAAQVVRSIAANDLTMPIAVSNNDNQSLLFAMHTMQQNLVKTVGEIRQSTDTIATATSQIAAGNLDLSSRTEEQASSLEETASSMEELTSTVKQNADNARQANQLAVSASEIAVKGGDVVSQVVDTMGSINDSAKKIVDIIGVIDGIAFQTNILALNAAVEAARAGEQGRGFAVVATEVRNLAQRSAAAAKEIKSLIDDSVKKVAVGSRLVGQAGTTMEEIVSSVKLVTDIMGEVTAASQEQSAGIEQVNQAITQMDEVTQQNAALVEEAAAAAASLQDQAGNLVQVASVFKMNNDYQVVRTSSVAPARVVHVPVQVTPQLRKVQPPKALTAQPPRKQVAIAAAGSDSSGDWEEF